jgi:hypothetical protein
MFMNEEREIKSKEICDRLVDSFNPLKNDIEEKIQNQTLTLLENTKFLIKFMDYIQKMVKEIYVTDLDEDTLIQAFIDVLFPFTKIDYSKVNDATIN